MASVPPSPQEVSSAVSGWLRARFAGEVDDAENPTRVGGGFDFWIYSLHFRGPALPIEWRSPLIARIPPMPQRYALLERESLLQDWSASHGYPAPRVWAVLEPGELFDQPVQLVARVPGRPMASAMTNAPWRIRRQVDGLADLHVRLHALPTPDETDPGEGASLADRRLELVRFVVERLGHPELASGLERITGLLPALEVPDPVVCHGDFHPLNLLVDDKGTWVVDWTDAAIGDRHGDISRTAWLFNVAGVAAPRRAQRALLSTVGPVLARRYLATYRQRRPIDTDRLRLWKPLHLLHAWAMAVADEAELAGPSRAGQDLRPGLARWASEQFSVAIEDAPHP